MTIAIIVEGESEVVFIGAIRKFLSRRCQPGKLPRLIARPLNGNVPPRSQLIKLVRNELRDGRNAVIVLTDVNGPMKFKNSQDAIAKIEESLQGLAELHSKVFVHAAQYELEAWVIPFWPKIQAILKSNKPKPDAKPELINHDRPPSRLLSELFRTQRKIRYSKNLHLREILEDQDLAIAAGECPGLKAFLNRILEISGCPLI